MRDVLQKVGCVGSCSYSRILQLRQKLADTKALQAARTKDEQQINKLKVGCFALLCFASCSVLL